LKLDFFAKQSHLAFETVMTRYQDVIATSGTIKCMNYANNDKGKVDHALRSCMVKPSMSDFIADVDICARKSLSPLQHRYFVQNYRSLNVLVEDQREAPECKILDQRVREHLGAQLVKSKLFPLTLYMEPVDTSRRMVRGVLMKGQEVPEESGDHLADTLETTIRVTCRRAA
jgi:hypothetical protein